MSLLELVKEQERDLDAALVEDCRNGDGSAFEELVGRYKDRIYNVAYRYLGNHEDAQDVAQEVFIRAHGSLDRFRGQSKVYTWLYSITGNLAKNKLRDGGRKGRDKGRSLEAMQESAPGVSQGLFAGGDTPEDIARGREVEDALQECLTALPEHYRMVFVLRTFEQLNYEEIAEAVGCPKGTVKSRLNHARKLLHGCLQEHSVI